MPDELGVAVHHQPPRGTLGNRVTEVVALLGLTLKASQKFYSRQFFLALVFEEKQLCRQALFLVQVRRLNPE